MCLGDVLKTRGDYRASVRVRFQLTVISKSISIGRCNSNRFVLTTRLFNTIVDRVSQWSRFREQFQTLACYRNRVIVCFMRVAELQNALREFRMGFVSNQRTRRIARARERRFTKSIIDCITAVIRKTNNK